jgi:glutathionylspermidine synthase
MTSPWVPVAPLGDEAFAEFRRRAIFDCCKWDPQVGDACVLARHPLVIRAEAWREVTAHAEALARETLGLEAALAERPRLHRRLGLPRAIRRALGTIASRGPSRGAARLVRFDFHFTDEGWRISEANTDVPGGLNEASGFPPLLAKRYPAFTPAGDPAAAYVSAAGPVAPETGAHVAFVHATAYSDDQQMMLFLARRFAYAGFHTHLASPSHLRWRDGRAHLDGPDWRGPLDLVVRFFPSEWLTLLPRATDWPALFVGSRTPLSNPATAVLTQTKRMPLVLDALPFAAPAWHALLPETRDPRDVPRRSTDEWVLKPALGRVGEDVLVPGVLDRKRDRQIRRAARFWPSQWVAQRRFQVVPLEIAGERRYPCLGVYTLDARVVGAYGRVASRPLIDSQAEDAAVLVAS